MLGRVDEEMRIVMPAESGRVLLNGNGKGLLGFTGDGKRSAANTTFSTPKGGA